MPLKILYHIFFGGARESEEKMTDKNTVPRMRTIKQAAAETGVPEYFVRRLVKDKKIVHVYAGSKALVNLDRFIEFLNGGQVE